MNRAFTLHATNNPEIVIEVGYPVYYTLPPSDELRLGRVSKIEEGRATVIRNGKREYVDVQWCTIAKRAYKNDLAS